MPDLQKSPTQLLLTYLRPQKWTVLALTFLLLTSIALQLANPQVMRTFLDGAQNRLPLPELINIALLFIGLAVLRHLFKISATYVGEHVAWNATNALRADLALHCLTLDMGFHKTHKPGELIERVDGDINQLATFFSQLVIQLSANILLAIGVMVLLWSIDWQLGLPISLLIIGGGVVARLINHTSVHRVQAAREADATLFGYLEEWLRGTETIRSNAAESFVMHRLYRLLRTRWHTGHASIKVFTALNAVPNVVFSLAYISVFTLGTWRFSSGQLSIGTLYIIFFYIDLLREPLWQFTRQIQQLQRALASLNRINDLFAARPTIHDILEPTVLPPAPQGLQVVIDNLSFAYADEPETPVLQAISFTLQPGTVLGLLGRTGSGKSTLTKLLLRFYDPTSGMIRLGSPTNQVDSKDLAQAELRRHIGVVTQQVQLFNGSVRDNLTLFDPNFADSHIIEALHTIGLGNWLATLPDGLDTHLAADGALSAGEAQLLAFTRVFLADPKLIILDEASSRLDPATELRIERALDKLLAGRTAVIVAHRLETVMRADEILILRQGRIQEHGPRASLLADPASHFNQLLQTGLEEVTA